MKKIIGYGLLTILLLISGCSNSIEPSTTSLVEEQPPTENPVISSGVKVISNLEYSKVGNNSLLLDLYFPDTYLLENTSALPVIIYVHGGGWRKGDKRECPAKELATELLTEGYVIACIDYRLSGQAKFPAQIQDVKAAVRWLRANAIKYNLNPDQFGAWGISAGGHLVSLLGTSGNITEFESGDNLEYSSQVQAVVDWFGSVDPLKIIGLNEVHTEYYEAVGELLGTSKLEQYSIEKVNTINPITYITADDPPFLIMHGDQDKTVPFNQSLIFYQALIKNKINSTLYEAKGEGHSLDDPKYIKMMVSFFDLHLKNKQ